MRKVRVRRLRHWKQRFNRDAKFVWRVRTVYAGREYWPGDTIPKDLEDRPTKLRRFWESRRIELAEFEAPDVATGQAERVRSLGLDLPEGVTVVRGKGSWFVVTAPDGHERRVNGRKALDKLLDELFRTVAAEADDDWLGGED